MKQTDHPAHIAVYCSASDNLPHTWTEAAARVGEIIGSTGSTLVYGGVDAGLMSVVARAVKSTGRGKVVGVVPALRSANASPLNDEQIDTIDLDDRKATMQRLADIFVVLPGGYGTLDELTGALAHIRFCGLTDKKILIFNPDHLYDPLIALFRNMADSGLLSADIISDLIFADDTHSLAEHLKTLINRL